MEKTECYGVDLDGTLAEYDGWKGEGHVGKAIPKMLDRVKKWIDDGIRIVIFTARAQDPEKIPDIKEWLKNNGLEGLEITNIKTHDISRIYDDRAIQVRRNEGSLIGDESLMIEWTDIPKAELKLYEIYNKK